MVMTDREKVLIDILNTIEELYDSETDRNDIFSDGFNYALDGMRTYVKAKLKEKNT
jgi:hypothetical protein